MSKLKELLELSEDVYDAIDVNEFTPECRAAMSAFSEFVERELTIDDQRMLIANLFGHLGKRDPERFKSLIEALDLGSTIAVGILDLR